jgi:hypothetical protein
VGSAVDLQGVAIRLSTETYEFHIKGRVGEGLVAEFDQLAADVVPTVTILHGPVRDQAELHALIDRFQSLGLELVEVRRRDRPERGLKS